MINPLPDPGFAKAYRWIYTQVTGQGEYRQTHTTKVDEIYQPIEPIVNLDVLLSFQRRFASPLRSS